MTTVTGWIPHRKILVAGTAGPILTAALAFATPHLSAPAAAFIAALVAAGIGYLTPSPSTTDTPTIASAAPPAPLPPLKTFAPLPEPPLPPPPPPAARREPPAPPVAP